MTNRFVQNRIDDLERVAAALGSETRDPDAKGLTLLDEVDQAIGFINRAVDVLRRSQSRLVEEEIERHSRTAQK